MNEEINREESHVIGGSQSYKRYRAREINSEEYVEGVQAEAKIIAENEIARSKERLELYGQRDSIYQRLLKIGRSLIHISKGNT
jgi:hypothetical protein